jgi:predicted dehydrogenase
MKRLRTAILGCGGWANKHAQNLAAQTERFEMSAFCDVVEANAQRFAEQYNRGKGAIFTDFHVMFGQVPLDLAVICLPPFAHSDEVEAAAAKGVHILIEKPIALSMDHAWRMVKAAEAAGIQTQVGFMYRFGAAIDRLKGLIASGEAGPVGMMAARYFCNHLHNQWWIQRDKSGGQLVEQVIHLVDLMRYLMGDAATVYSLQKNLFHQDVPNYSVEDMSGTVVGFKGGGIGVIYASNNAIPYQWIGDYHVVAQKITANFSDANHAHFVFTGDRDNLTTEDIASEEDCYLLELLDLYRAITKGSATRTPIREGALSLELALAATRSAQTQAVVSL